MSGQEITAVTQKSTKSCVTSSIDNKGDSDVPLDFSYWSVSDFEEVSDFDDDPRSSGGKKIKQDEDQKFITKSIKLSYNQFTEFKGFMAFLEAKVAQPSALSWIDLSFNQLTLIDSVLCELPNLRILYLHSNFIKDLKELDNLRNASTLYKLTLHGNPIATEKQYKSAVLSALPNVKSFDCSLVSKADRANAATYQSSNATKRRRAKRDN